MDNLDNDKKGLSTSENNSTPPKDETPQADNTTDGEKQADKNKPETGQTAKGSPTEKKKRTHRKYTASINLPMLKKMEGSTTSSFLDLARAVILINDSTYNEKTLPLSKARKIDFERLIAHHAQLVVFGKRKYHIKAVVNRKPKDEYNDIELEIIRQPVPIKKQKKKEDTEKDKGQ